MRVALVHNAVLPVHAYGGTERVVWWLAKFLHQLGVEVVLVAAPGTSDLFGPMVAADFSKPIEPQVPHADVFHFFNTPLAPPTRPYLVTIGGNGKPGEVFLTNTVFVSRNHALRHGAEAFVHNGIDPEAYEFRNVKDRNLVFLAKASWKVKNVRGAIRIARRTSHPLQILGGSRWWLPRWRGVEWCGMVGGEEKRKRLAASRGLLFPVLWDEPFGIAVVEALVSGTPVLATPFGSLPELVHPSVGQICSSEDEFVRAVDHLGSFSAERCREWALDRFSATQMAKNYVKLYDRVVAGMNLNPRLPVTQGGPRDFRLA